MEEILQVYDDLKKKRGVKKGLLSRTVDTLRTVVSLGEESDIDEVYGEWLRAQRHDVDTNAEVAAKTLEALSIITDRLTSQEARPSIRTTGMSPPKSDGQVKNFCSWICQFRQYMKSADEDELMFVLHTSVLPPRVTFSTIQSCTTMCGPNGVWERLQEKIPKAAVTREIIAEMEAIRPIRQKTASEMRAVLDRLTDFARRIKEVGKDTELTSSTVIHIVSGKLHPDLYCKFERWMRHDFPAELSVTRIIEFLRAETEARETISPRDIKSELRRPSVHHVTEATNVSVGVWCSPQVHRLSGVPAATTLATPQKYRYSRTLLQLFLPTPNHRMPEAESVQRVWKSTSSTAELYHHSRCQLYAFDTAHVDNIHD